MDVQNLAQIVDGIALAASGALTLTLDGHPLEVQWMLGWGDRERLHPLLADPAQPAAYQAQIRLQVRNWLDMIDALARLLEGWGTLAPCAAPQAVLPQWRTQLLDMLTTLEQWDANGERFPCMGWFLPNTGGNDGAI